MIVLEFPKTIFAIDRQMSKRPQTEGVHFFYDGECPICTHAAQALRIKQDYGELHLVDTRNAAQNPLLAEINKLGFDLDEGMVIYADEHFYHGTEALKFMAQYGEPQTAFMIFCKSLFWSNRLSRLLYPWMRGARNWFLRRKHVGRIDNLDLKEEAIFSSVFGESWNELPPVMHLHYGIRPYTEDAIQFSGQLNVMSKAPITWLSWLMSMLGQIPVRNQKQVSVVVHFMSDRDSKAFHFLRVFKFRGEQPYIFRSQIVQKKNDEVYEIMRFGFCWKARIFWDNEKVVLEHKGYAIRILGHFIPLPLTYLLGKGYAEESAVDDSRFEMITHITHPWWGKIYEYKGRFEVLN